MFVIKRSGQKVPIRYDSITDRNVELARGLNINVDVLSKNVIVSLKDGMTTQEIDELASETAAYMSTYEPEYDTLAAKICVSNHHKSTLSSFYETMKLLFEAINPSTKKKCNILSEEFMAFVEKHRDALDSAIIHENDYNYTYFGFKTLYKLYLQKITEITKKGNHLKTIERPQHMLMRVAVAIHFNFIVNDDLSPIIESYKEFSKGTFTHASQTLFNAGSKYGNLSSCFLLQMDDSMEHIYETNKRCAMISKFGGGIGIDITRVRAKGSPIHSTNGHSDGLVPMCQVLNATCRYANQSSRRKGSFAAYLQPWHPDVMDFLALRLNSPPEELRARDLFLAMWIPDIFMRRVEEDREWSLICPSVEPRLLETYGDEFDQIYLEAERVGKYTKQIKARDVWAAILDSQIESGLPYILYKDHINKKSNQKNIGIINSSNLCVSGDTTIYTRHGYIPIDKFVNELVELWNGKEWTLVTVRQTSNNSVLYRVEFSNGRFVDCTDYHKIPVKDHSGSPKTGERGFNFKHLKDCKIGTVLADYTIPINDETSVTWSDVQIVSIKKKDGFHPTYSFTDQKNGTGLFNGVMLGNCTEIMEYTSPDSVAVCNLSSISLPSFVKFVDNETIGTFNHQELGRIVKMIVRNLNHVIDVTFYPIQEAKKNNLNYRPIGIGVQGLADVFAILKLPFDSKEAILLNQQIFETIYYYALEASHELAMIEGPYSAFEGSPVSKGILQFHMWDKTPSDLYDWGPLIEKCKLGVRNSLLVSPMPTASTAQILGNNEACEAYTSNVYSRSTLAGDFVVVNKHLYKDLKELGLWTKDMVNKIIENNGSVQTIEEIPETIKQVYKTVWEINQKVIIDMSADRGAFIDQSQSLNIFFEKPVYSKLTSMHFYGWKKGLKTGSYYIRSKPARDAVKFTILQTEEKKGKEFTKNGKKYVCYDDVCTSCSS